MNIGQFSDKLHPSLANPTKLWGYNPSLALDANLKPTANFTQKHLGGIIVAQRDTPIQITFKNNLPSSHIIPVDTTIPGANQAQNRTAVHLHGGLVPWISDGGPFDWWTPPHYNRIGLSRNTWTQFPEQQVLNPGADSGQAEYYYPNNQGARVVWYHDHACGITRINAYAGIASAYVITDWLRGSNWPLRRTTSRAHLIPARFT